jgi:hypothetical protein
MTNPVQTDPARQALETEEPSLPVLPIQFIPIREYTTFAAEVAVTDGDLVYHFYVTDEVNALSQPNKYWLETFPRVLDQVARAYFNAEFPSLKAAYTEEKASWWLRAFGFGMVLNPHKRAYGLFDLLDAALETEIKN